MFNHLVSLEEVITELYKSGKVECFATNGVVYSYKIEATEATYYFDGVRAHDVIEHNKSWSIRNTRVLCWNGHFHSHVTLSREGLSLTAFYQLVRSI